MALGSYVDLYTTNQVIKREQELEAALSISDQNIKGLIDIKKEELKVQIKALREKEKSLFALFGDDINNIDDLNARLKEYKSYTLALSGPEMMREFLWVLKNQNETSADLFIDATREVIQSWIGEVAGDKEWPGWKAAHDIVMEQLNKDFRKTSSDKLIISFRSEAGWRDAASLQDLQILQFTSAQRKRLTALMKQKFSSEKYPNVQKYLDEAEAIQSGKGGEYTFNWFRTTHGASSTDAYTMLSVKQIQEINDYLTNLIVSKTTKHQDLMRKVLAHILRQSDKTGTGDLGLAFFVGKSINDVEGILGEIQSLFYLCLLTGREPDESLFWKGGLIGDSNGKKPHQDIVLNSIGIQVKNTTTDILSQGDMKVGFKEKKLDNFLTDLGLSEGVKNLFSNYYGTIAFNVPYIYNKDAEDGNKYQRAAQSKSESFNEVHEKIVNLQPQIDKLMSLFTAALMYMDVSDDVNKLTVNDLNTLYMLGGVAAVTASQILDDCLKQYDAEDYSFYESSDFQSRTSVRGQGKRTIVTALNNDLRQPDYSTDVLSDIILKSSYVFKINP